MEDLDSKEVTAGLESSTTSFLLSDAFFHINSVSLTSCDVEPGVIWGALKVWCQPMVCQIASVLDNLVVSHCHNHRQKVFAFGKEYGTRMDLRCIAVEVVRILAWKMQRVDAIGGEIWRWAGRRPTLRDAGSPLRQH